MGRKKSKAQNTGMLGNLELQRISEEARKREEARAAENLKAKQAYMTQLREQAEGKGPSLAAEQLKAGSERSLAGQLAAAAAARGGSSAARQRGLMQSQQASGRQLAQDAALARMQEQASARQMYGGMLGEEQAAADALKQSYLDRSIGRTQDWQAGEQKAQERKSTMTGNIVGGLMGAGASALPLLSDVKSKQAPSKLDNKSEKETDDKASDVGKSMMDDSFKKSFEAGQSLVKALSDKESKKSMYKEKMLPFEKKSDEKTKKVPKVDIEKAKSLQKGIENPDPIVRKIQSWIGSDKEEDDEKTHFTSDVESKKNLEYSDKSTKKFLDALKPVAFEYKDEYKDSPQDEGEQLGIIAQDLEKAGPAGKRMVSKDENGIRHVDFGKGFGAILASQAYLNKKISELESKKKKK